MRCSKCEKVSAGRHDMADWLSGIEAKIFSGLPSGKMLVFTSLFLALGHRDWLNQGWAKYHGFLAGENLDTMTSWRHGKEPSAGAKSTMSLSLEADSQIFSYD